MKLAEWFSKDKRDVEFVIYDFTKIEEQLIENSKRDSKKSDLLVTKPDKIFKVGTTEQKFSQVADHIHLNYTYKAYWLDCLGLFE